MARERPHLFSLNGGVVSPLALGRTDLARMRITADEFHNCFPATIGPLKFRPGLGWEGTVNANREGRHIPFIFSVDDTALIEITDQEIRPILNGAVLFNSTTIDRGNVATTITNGNFSSGTGWTVVSGDINSTVSGALVLRATARGITASASRTFTVAGGDLNDEHGVRITITRGIVLFRMGTSAGGQEILTETELGPGVHSLAFTPTAGTIHVEFNSKSETQVVVDEIRIEDNETLELPSPWRTADLPDLRYTQSGDVIFVVHPLYQPRRIERRGTRSWSITRHESLNGPWRSRTANVALTPSVGTGNGTMTADSPFFTPEHVGAMFELYNEWTYVLQNLANDDVYTDWVRVSGYMTDSAGVSRSERSVLTQITGTWSGTVTRFTADDPNGPWRAAQGFNANTAGFLDYPGSNGQITYVRYGFSPGGHTSGTATVLMNYNGGGGPGVVRVTGYNSPTSVNIEVIGRLHAYAQPCSEWRESLFSDLRGWPSAVELFEGRLWFGSSDKLVGSASDDFVTFYEEEVVDSSPIVRSVASGPVNRVQWLIGLARLLVGTSGAEGSARSSSFDEPITPSNFSIKDASSIGSAPVQAVKVDRSGVFIGRSGKRAHILSYAVEAQDYDASEVTRYNPSILNAGVKVMAVQRQPDTRVWFVLNDGKVAVLTYEPAEDVLSWSTFDTDGLIEDVCVLPNAEGDDVYFIVNRTINGTPTRFRERLAYESQAEGGTENLMADSFVYVPSWFGLSSLPTHLAGKQVVIWQDGAPYLDANGEPVLVTASGGGSVALPAPANGPLCVGLPYEGRFKSTKLAYAAQTGTAVTQRKIINRVAPLLYKTHSRAVLFGDNFTRMDPLPRDYRGVDLGVNAFLEDYDSDGFSLPGSWSTDSRLCMKFRAPLPATVLGVILEIESHERA
jgi:hypothetical protein